MVDDDKDQSDVDDLFENDESLDDDDLFADDTSDSTDLLAEDDDDDDDEDSDLEVDTDEFELDDEEDAFGSDEDDESEDDDYASESQLTPDKKKIALAFGGVITVLFVIWQVIGSFGGSPEDQVPTEIAQADIKAKSDASATDLDLFASEQTSPATTDMASLPAPMTTDAMPAPKVADMPVSAPTLPTVQQLPMPVIPAPAVPQVDLKPIEDKIQAMTDDLGGITKNIGAVNEALNTRLRRLESGLRNVTDDLDDINRYLGHMNEQVGGVTKIVEQMSSQFNSLGDSMDTDRKDLANLDTYANPTLRVHAIIPGRAWLKKRDGSVQTVTEGDMIGEYGKVLAIDAPAGSVVTSSGVTLR